MPHLTVSSVSATCTGRAREVGGGGGVPAGPVGAETQAMLSTKCILQTCDLEVSKCVGNMQDEPERLGEVVASLQAMWGLKHIYCWHGLAAYWSGVATGQPPMPRQHVLSLIFSRTYYCLHTAGVQSLSCSMTFPAWSKKFTYHVLSCLSLHAISCLQARIPARNEAPQTAFNCLPACWHSGAHITSICIALHYITHRTPAAPASTMLSRKVTVVWLACALARMRLG